MVAVLYPVFVALVAHDHCVCEEDLDQGAHLYCVVDVGEVCRGQRVCVVCQHMSENKKNFAAWWPLDGSDSLALVAPAGVGVVDDVGDVDVYGGGVGAFWKNQWCEKKEAHVCWRRRSRRRGKGGERKGRGEGWEA